MEGFGRISALVVVGSGLLVAATRADDGAIPLSQVPKAVLATFKARFPDAVVKAAYKEVEEGKTTYEIESLRKGLSIDAVLTPNGQFVSISKEIALGKVPAAVVAAVRAKYPKSQIEEASEETEDGETYLELIVKKANGKKVTISIDDDGTNLEEEPAP